MNLNSDCIFCKIVQGTLPCTRVFEDEHTLAFMDIAPVIRGHVLVIPKQHWDPLTALPAELLQHLILSVQRVTRAQMAGLRADGANVMQANGPAAGQVVPHVHFHIIPRFADDGHSWNWRAQAYKDVSEARELAAKIQGAMTA